jgi:hypothetical protein
MQIREAHIPSLWIPDKRDQYCYNTVHLPIFRTSAMFDNAQRANSGSMRQAQNTPWNLLDITFFSNVKSLLPRFDVFVQHLRTYLLHGAESFLRS